MQEIICQKNNQTQKIVFWNSCFESYKKVYKWIQFDLDSAN